MDGGPELRALKYSLDCTRINRACTIKICGEFDEVLEEAVAHARRAHAAPQDESVLRESLRPWIRQEAIEWLWQGMPENGKQAGWPA